MDKTYRFIATAPRGSVDLLSEELLALGVESTRQRWGGMEFYGTLAMAYRVCLWSRLANRLFLPLAEFPAPTPEALYEGAHQIDWSEHMDPDSTLAVDCTSLRAKITHSHYATLKVKDAVVDQFRARTSVRPSIDVERPDLRISARLSEDLATISLDLSGESLHRRGYRDSGSRAPLKENLAAAILVRAGWPQVLAAGGGLLDPMCGSGTLPIEAGLIAADCARQREGLKKMPEIFGCDIDERIIRNARANAERAGLGQVIRFEPRGLQYSAPLAGPPGLLVANPPYGERLGNEREIKELFAGLGGVIKARFAGWKAAVFTGRPDLGRFLGMRAVLTNKFNNGPIECRLLRFEVEERYFSQPAPTPAVPISSGAEMLTNRLKKNRRTLGRWAKRSGIDCYRIYDADLPEYALAIDLYQGEEVWAHVQEYQAPASVDAERAKSRLEEALAALPKALDIPNDHVYFKVRQRQRGRAQYEKFSTTGVFHSVREGAGRFLVNFTDYLDTGLFLDHRPTRLMLGEMASGKRVLNLFAYTATATVHAALGGAAATTSIDMSNTYLDWARRNLDLNNIRGGQHQLLQADCLEWLTQKHSERYDLIFLDPPTFSNSKRMEDHFDVQNDHADLLRRTTELLEPNGVLIFSNNFRRFRMDHENLPGLVLEDITPQTIDKDFERRARIHSCWKITKA